LPASWCVHICRSDMESPTPVEELDKDKEKSVLLIHGIGCEHVSIAINWDEHVEHMCRLFMVSMSNPAKISTCLPVCVGHRNSHTTKALFNVCFIKVNLLKKLMNSIILSRTWSKTAVD
jgi:hypothetical protein